ncbi:GNAT family N-acetyltransferase [Salinarimonas rosea]|uniref:GNAT family N-acetyltransferase n=1 Tax=Salinarimonas rosea TaxID=552063 RepID=UPI00042A33D8|nr:GNAT family N-acetyltransferase [Salinarimonas rosea]
MRIRPARPADREALLAISLATGDAGGDAAPLHCDGRLVGLIYSAPYLALEPGLALVAEDDAGVVGFAVGTAETRAFEARLERDWWPALREAHPHSGGDPACWDADQRRVARFHAPRIVPDAVVAGHPAHLHLNLLPRARGRGVGRRLLAAWLERLAAAEGGPVSVAERPVHVGVHPRNAGALAFWSACGFARIGAPQALADEATMWLGRTEA